MRKGLGVSLKLHKNDILFLMYTSIRSLNVALTLNFLKIPYPPSVRKRKIHYVLLHYLIEGRTTKIRVGNSVKSRTQKVKILNVTKKIKNQDTTLRVRTEN